MDEPKRTVLGAIIIPGAMPVLNTPHPTEYLGKVVQWSTNPGWNYIFSHDNSKCCFSISDEILAVVKDHFSAELTQVKPTVTPESLVLLKKGDFTIDDILRLKKEGLL